MFSYFKDGIKDTTPQKSIDILSYIKELKSNPAKELVERIRKLRANGDDTEYKELKKTLRMPYFTPNCVVKRRSLKGKEGQNNFIGW